MEVREFNRVKVWRLLVFRFISIASVTYMNFIIGIVVIVIVIVNINIVMLELYDGK